MDAMMHGAKEMMKGKDVKSIKIKDGDKKLKVKFQKKDDDKYESKKKDLAEKKK